MDFKTNPTVAGNSLPVVVRHGSTAGTARPTGVDTVLWIGTVAPSNADTTKDLWLDTT